jgi:hypothetical protein
MSVSEKGNKKIVKEGEKRRVLKQQDKHTIGVVKNKNDWHESSV